MQAMTKNLLLLIAIKLYADDEEVKARTAKKMDKAHFVGQGS